jgi:hypothetical protein
MKLIQAFTFSFSYLILQELGALYIGPRFKSSKSGKRMNK